MTSGLDKLLTIAGPALGSSDVQVGPVSPHSELAVLLRRRNGFYAFENALHVFPSGTGQVPMSVEFWNSGGLWRDAYPDISSDVFFFAEDVFGDQFFSYSDGVGKFDSETGEIEHFSDNFDDWANNVMEDYEAVTGHPLAQAWQRANRPLLPGERLVPKRPFFAGGDFAERNLYAADAVKAMRYKGDIACQIANLPDGAQIELRVIE